MKYFHNPRCTKSRLGLDYLSKRGVAFEIIEYLKTPLTEEELKQLLHDLNMKAIDLIRENDASKFNIVYQNLTEMEAEAVLLKYPQLMERPILWGSGIARIGRPVENFDVLIKAG